MPVKSKPVKLSFIPGRLKRLLEFGAEHRWQSTNGSLNAGFIVMRIIEFVLDLRSDPDVRKYLDRHGGTLLDLILRAVKRYTST